MHLISHRLNDRGSWLLIALMLFGGLAIWTTHEHNLRPMRSQVIAPKGLAILMGTKIDLNSASVSELKQIPKLSTKVAEAIVARRQALGGSYSNYEEIDEIKGIGEKTLSAIRFHTILNR